MCSVMRSIIARADVFELRVHRAVVHAIADANRRCRRSAMDRRSHAALARRRAPCVSRCSISVRRARRRAARRRGLRHRSGRGARRRASSRCSTIGRRMLKPAVAGEHLQEVEHRRRRATAEDAVEHLLLVFGRDQRRAERCFELREAWPSTSLTSDSTSSTSAVAFADFAATARKACA